MNIYVSGLQSSYDIEHLVRLFWPQAGIKQGRAHKDGQCVAAYAGKNKIACAVRQNGKCIGVIQPYFAKNQKEASAQLAQLCYKMLCGFTNKRLAWGSLTGVRPVRLIHDMWAMGKTDDFIKDKFIKYFDVTAQKFDLAMQTAKIQNKVIAPYDKHDCSLYVAIPFCPSRCSYCSFVSRTIEKCGDLVQPYVDKLCIEIQTLGKIIAKNKLKLKTIYIGGGTPTSLSAQQLKTIMQTINNSVDVKGVLEYTVEAGRPDCTDAEKLLVIKQMGATRLSINPQTLNDGVLQNIGRRHTADDIIKCYNTARSIGHNNINMDLIAGLPGDTVKSFEDSLNGVIALQPQNITVHTLTLKRASNLVIDNIQNDYANVAQMLEKQTALVKNGYSPYYLYRQKGTLQNLENTGFAKQGFEGLYNIYIMEEIHTIFSAGAGGVTKLKSPCKTERIFNFKYPNEYVNDFNEILKRKERANEFYGSYLDT